jgi:hypothetical protein
MNRDFAEILAALSAAGVEFLVVGAYAMAAHGVPRATGDIDIWVRPTPENADRVLSALRAFGAPLFDLTREDLLRPDVVFQIGVALSRIDILTGITGVGFEDAWRNRLTVTHHFAVPAKIASASLSAFSSSMGRSLTRRARALSTWPVST